MIRKTISLTTFFSFLLLMLSSVILYIVPEGRVAYWSDWSILGFSKSQWGNLHITTGLLFLIVGCWHLILNWKPIVNYIKKGASHVSIKPTPIILAILINLFIFVGTFMGWQPMKQILTWNADIKAYQARVNGNPPYGHAELSSLENFCGFLGLNKEEVLQALKNKGLKGEVTLQTTIIQIAKANQMTPQNVYDLIQETTAKESSIKLPATPPQGLGQMPIKQLCTTYNLEISQMIEGLKKKGLSVNEENTIKEIAAENGMTPLDVYEIIKKIIH